MNPAKPDVSVLILAAGRGVRFGGDKARAVLGGKPVWRWSYDVFAGHPSVSQVIMVGDVDLADGVASVSGGATRLESCRAGLTAVNPQAQIVLVHDAARPFVDEAIIDRVVLACQLTGAAAAATGVVDTLRRRDAKAGIVDRNALMAMQTPQGAKADLLRRALAAASDDCPDEIAALVAIGAPWEAVDGDPANFKLTYPGDLRRAEQTLRHEVRAGLGYDVHSFSTMPGRDLWLGGVHFPGEQGLEGHSDADALSHAIVDAILGGATLGDIGVHFPPSEPRWKGEPSSTFLRHAAKLASEAGWKIAQVDASLIAEKPKVMPRAVEIREALAASLGIDQARVSVKATTNEGLGSIGRGEGIAAFAIATLERWR